MYRTLQGLGICIFLTTEDKEKGFSDEEIVLRENTRLKWKTKDVTSNRLVFQTDSKIKLMSISMVLEYDLTKVYIF